MRRGEGLERVRDRDAREAGVAEQPQDARRPRGRPAAVRPVRGVGDHDERDDARGDRAPVRHEARSESRCVRVDRDGGNVGRDGREAEPGEVLQRRCDAAVEEARGERGHRLRGASGDRREAATLLGDERPFHRRDVRDRREIDVDAEPLEGLRGRAPPASESRFGEATELVGGRGRWRPAEASGEAALLVGHDQERPASLAGSSAQRGRQRPHLRRAPDVRAHEDHAADPPSADPGEQRGARGRALHPDHEPRADERLERLRRGRRGRRDTAEDAGGEQDRGGEAREQTAQVADCNSGVPMPSGAPRLRGPGQTSSASARTENGSRQSSSASPSIVSRHS